MRVLVTGGGTGGHVYPALSVLGADDGGTITEVLWVGTQGGMEQELVERAGVKFVGIQAGGLRGLNPLVQARSIARLMQGFAQAVRIVRQFRPDVVFATGGYVTAPVCLAAWLQRRPIVVYLPDLEPGWAIQSIAPLARRIAVTATPTVSRFAPGKAVATGYPVRREVAHPKPREAARATFGIAPAARLLLVFGGSQGAQVLNRAIGTGLLALLQETEVIHIHGKSDGEWLQQQRAALPDMLRARYHLFDYLHGEMADALAAADLVASRAGASILGEYPAVGLPAVLVPLPLKGVQQADNAAFLSERGAAVTLPNERVGAELVPLVLDLLRDPTHLKQMRDAMTALARPDAAANILALLKSYPPRGHAA